MRRVDPIERHLFLEAIFMRYGYDFRQYSEASLDRRLGAVLARFEHKNLIETLQMVLASSESFRQLLPLLTIGTTEFFRDPLFFRSLREKVLPVLKSYPSLNFWVAGCSTGEELYSLVIALKEEGLYDRSTIFATDVNPLVLKKAKEGIFEIAAIQTFIKNYAAAGGKESPAEYYTAEYGLVRFDPQLRENVVFQEHNLASDAVFSENHLILCRNVMIYFNKELQDRVFKIFSESLVYRGFLGIGSKESLRFSNSAAFFESVMPEQNIYQLKLSKPADGPRYRGSL